ncbi:MAG: murein biosynthesis integral membrane protein MurJ [Proteobacteria bacterium]|nr:murein biosynthesis integral membrane protein MurJ [Pseudomonadota bacterium]
MTVFRSSLTIGTFTLGSRLLGFARDVIMAQVLGAGPMADAFFVALRLPNLFRQLMAEGAFNVAFVPMLTRKLSDGEDRSEAESFANAVFALLFTLSFSLTVLGMVFMPYLVMALAPGFIDDAERFDLAVTLGRITFPYLTFIVFVSYASGITNTLGRFALGAAAPMFLNIAFIFCLLLLPGHGVSAGQAAAWAVPLGGAMQAGLMLWAIRKVKFGLRLHMPHKHPALATLLRRLGASMLGVGVQLFNSVFSTFLASNLVAGSISYLFYADRLNQLPLALVGIAIGTALLPHLSRALKNDDMKGASQAFGQAIVFGFCLALAAAAGLFMLADELMRVLFMRGAFDANAAHQTALALMAYSLGLPAYILVKITATVFYAAEDTKTPFQTAVVSLIVNVVASLALIVGFAHVGLALAGGIAAWVNVAVQGYLIYKRGLMPQLKASYLRSHALRAVLVNLVLVAVVMGYKTLLPLPAAGILGAAWLSGAIVLALVTFVGGLVVTGLLDKSLIRRFRNRR